MTLLAAGRRCPGVAVEVAVEVSVEVACAVEESSVERSGTGACATARGYWSTINAPPPTPASIHLRWRSVAQRLLRALPVVEREIRRQANRQLAHRGITLRIHVRILDVTPKPLDRNVVEHPPPPVHADGNPTLAACSNCDCPCATAVPTRALVRQTSAPTSSTDRSARTARESARLSPPSLGESNLAVHA